MENPGQNENVKTGDDQNTSDNGTVDKTSGSNRQERVGRRRSNRTRNGDEGAGVGNDNQRRRRRQQRQRSKSKSLSPRSRGHRRRSQQNELRLDLLRRSALLDYNTAEYFTRWLRFSNTSLSQQRLYEYSPVFNYRLVGRIFLFLSAIIGPIGLFFVLSGNHAKDFMVNYGDECLNQGNYLRLLRIQCVFCRGGSKQTCDIVWELKENLRTPVFVYYELNDIIQNHRALVSSYDLNQITGHIFDDKTRKVINSSYSCAPLIQDAKYANYFPCGAMANMMFSDDFSIKTEEGKEVKLRKKGVAHSMLKQSKYRNPPEVNKKNYYNSKKFTDNFVKPKDWSKEQWDGFWKNGGIQNEAFINWMVISAKSTIRKLYGVIESVPECHPGIVCKGNYSIHIDYRFDAHGFGGTKSLVFSTISMTGTRNRFTGYFAIFLASVQFALGFYFLQVLESRRMKRAKLLAVLSSSSLSSSSSSSLDSPPPSLSHLPDDDDQFKENEMNQLYPKNYPENKSSEEKAKVENAHETNKQTTKDDNAKSGKKHISEVVPVSSSSSKPPPNNKEKAANDNPSPGSSAAAKRKVAFKLSESAQKAKKEDFKTVYRSKQRTAAFPEESVEEIEYISEHSSENSAEEIMKE